MSDSSVITLVPDAIVSVMTGFIVRCLTSGNILMTTSPPRSLISRMGGFSFSSVPRPASPCKRRRRPGRPFFNGFRMTFVTSDDVGLVALDKALKRRFRFPLYDAAA